jgi:putative photosynthetic complex assembly protein
VRVIDASDGTVIDELPPGTNGFVRGTLRSLVRARRAADVGSDTPFSLRETETGRLLFHDSATGREIDLRAFGPTNAGVFRRFLEQDSPQTVATATQPALESDGPAVTAVALKKQETTP